MCKVELLRVQHLGADNDAAINALSNTLLPTVALFRATDARLEHPLYPLRVVRDQATGQPDMYSYEIPTTPDCLDWLVTVSIENCGPDTLTLRQRCVPTHGVCLDQVQIESHEKALMQLRPPAAEHGAGFDIVDAATDSVLLRLRFSSRLHPHPELTALLAALRARPRLYNL